MSKVFIEEDTLIGIGNAIREKSGTTDLIPTTDMATAIRNLTTGGGAMTNYAVFKDGNSQRTYTPSFSIADYLDKPFLCWFNRASSTSTTSGYGTMPNTPTICYYDGKGNVSIIATGSGGLESVEIKDNIYIVFTFTSYCYAVGSSGSQYRYLHMVY